MGQSGLEPKVGGIYPYWCFRQKFGQSSRSHCEGGDPNCAIPPLRNLCVCCHQPIMNVILIMSTMLQTKSGFESIPYVMRIEKQDVHDRCGIRCEEECKFNRITSCCVERLNGDLAQAYMRESYRVRPVLLFIEIPTIVK